ncbi:MAG: PspC domain-containing protein [Candidatus Paceibacterota bacterium]
MAEEIKRFYRSRTDRVLFGVCGGLGKYFGIDAILFRMFFLLLLFTGGAGVPLYIIMIVIIPLEPGEVMNQKQDLKAEAEDLKEKIDQKAKELSGEFNIADEKSRFSRNTLGAIIIIFGVFFLLRAVFPMFWLADDILVPMAIIAIGALIFFKK